MVGYDWLDIAAMMLPAIRDVWIAQAKLVGECGGKYRGGALITKLKRELSLITKPTRSFITYQNQSTDYLHKCKLRNTENASKQFGLPQGLSLPNFRIARSIDRSSSSPALPLLD
jgi:hypothetical protein